MKIGITGATGFIGSRVGELAMERGHELVAFTRRAAEMRPGRAEIRPFSTDMPPDVSGLEAVVNLAGESILGRWTAEKKKRIMQSRVLSTRRIVEAIAESQKRPHVLVSGSAIGFYGDTGEALADENSPCGKGFLADVCVEWEAEARKAEALGVRVVLIRTGFVLGRGGALKFIGPVFRLGLGGRLGGGRQWMSGVHVDDEAGLILWAVENDTLRGPVNAVLPEPFRNEEFTSEVARAVRRPAFLPVPAFALRIALGEASRMLLDNSRVKPRRAGECGYVFRFASLPAALREALAKPR